MLQPNQTKLHNMIFMHASKYIQTRKPEKSDNWHRCNKTAYELRSQPIVGRPHIPFRAAVPFPFRDYWELEADVCYCVTIPCTTKRATSTV